MLVLCQIQEKLQNYKKNDTPKAKSPRKKKEKKIKALNFEAEKYLTQKTDYWGLSKPQIEYFLLQNNLQITYSSQQCGTANA